MDGTNTIFYMQTTTVKFCFCEYKEITDDNKVLRELTEKFSTGLT